MHTFIMIPNGRAQPGGAAKSLVACASIIARISPGSMAQQSAKQRSRARRRESTRNTSIEHAVSDAGAGALDARELVRGGSSDETD